MYSALSTESNVTKAVRMSDLQYLGGFDCTEKHLTKSTWWGGIRWTQSLCLQGRVASFSELQALTLSHVGSSLLPHPGVHSLFPLLLIILDLVQPNMCSQTKYCARPEPLLDLPMAVLPVYHFLPWIRVIIIIIMKTCQGGLKRAKYIYCYWW